MDHLENLFKEAERRDMLAVLLYKDKLCGNVGEFLGEDANGVSDNRCSARHCAAGSSRGLLSKRKKR